jgi:hypothetical protein
MDQDIVHDQQIHCAEHIIFKVPGDNANPLLNLLTVYFTFNIRYPALFGLLTILDKFCIGREDFVRDTPSTMLKKFVTGFSIFMAQSV